MPTLAYTYKAWILLLQTFGGLFFAVSEECPVHVSKWKSCHNP